MFTPIWGRFPFWLIFFKGVETTNQLSYSMLIFQGLSEAFWICNLGWANLIIDGWRNSQRLMRFGNIDLYTQTAPGCLGDIGCYTTLCYGVYYITLKESLLNNHDSMESKSWFFGRGSYKYINIYKWHLVMWSKSDMACCSWTASWVLPCMKPCVFIWIARGA